MKEEIRALIAEMSLEEKASLCSGKNLWETKNIERLGVPSISMTDGPHGLRKQVEGGSLELYDSFPATCFPTAVALASSWDRELLEKVGRALGKECRAQGVSILLGPGANIKRSPLCGRNFEYFSEDPYLSSELATAYIKGLQSQGVGACLKHFVANNQEHRRMTINVCVDERTLREIYLASFETTVKNAKPQAVMCAYNRVNGKYCAENENLLIDILRKEWEYEGIVISDWGAVDERVDALKAGLDLEMPSSHGIGDNKIIEAVRSGQLDESILNKAVERILRVVFETANNDKKVDCDLDVHHQLAREIARECMVLLKNDGGILPLKEEGTIGIVGAFAKEPRYQGSGSSRVNPFRLENAYDEIRKIAGEKARILYAPGYRLETDEIDEDLLKEAKSVAQKSDVVLVFVGLPDRYESEGYDRLHLKLPTSHTCLIEAVAETQRNTVVVLSNGSPVEMPWLSKVKGVLEAYLGGQAAGGAIADILFGKVSPCGKLAETFPRKLSDNPSYLSFPGERDKVEYREGLFVGYRYYDKKEIEPLFPFGYGLSYTDFEYTRLSLSKKEIAEDDILEVRVNVKNIGNFAGKEIIQLYVKDVESSVIRPEKELKGFAKVALKPGEEKEVVFALGKRAFAYYDEDVGNWRVESGLFEILIGRSSRDIVLRETVRVNSMDKNRAKYYTRNVTLGDLMDDPIAAPVVEELVDKYDLKGRLGFTLKYLPLRSLIYFSDGAINEEHISQILHRLNGNRDGNG